MAKTRSNWTCLHKLLLVSFYTLLLLSWPCLVLSFEIVLPFSLYRSSPSLSSLRHTLRPCGTRCAAQVQDTEEDAPIDEETSSSKPRPPQRQLWLDLRGTAIRPDEALAFLDEFLPDENEGSITSKSKDESSSPSSHTTPAIVDLIDCILVPRDTLAEMPPRGVTSKVELLVVDEDDQPSLVHDLKGQLKGAFVPEDATPFWMNPLDVIDLYNKGEWILFESTSTNDGNELTAWVEHIGSLLQLLPATAAPESLETPSGLVLPTRSSDDLSSSEQSTCKGGVGICCTTRQAVFGVDTLLEQVLSNSAGSTEESSESGILLLTNTDDDDNLAMPITSALILPFDLNLWKAVLELRNDTR